jgi:hypothetical protein
MTRIGIAAAALLAAPVMGGGFWITVERNTAAPETGGLVRVTGCQRPQDAQVTARAEGLVNGRRESAGVQLRATGRAGVYEIRRPRLSAGAWVLAVTARLGEAVTSELAPLDAGGAVAPAGERSGAQKPGQFAYRPLTAEDVEAALRQLAGQPSAGR